jgi:lipopolysaccharide heptosyltransferase II
VDLDEVARRRGEKNRILVTRLRYLGDVILTTPALAALKGRYPGSEIHYLAERPYATILEGNPDLAGIIDVARDIRGSLATLGRLRRGGFVAAIDLFYNPRSALLMYLSGIPVRAGGSRRFRRRLYTHRFTVSPGTRSATMHHLEAMRIFDAEPNDSLPRIFLSIGELDAGRNLLERTLGGERGPTIAMHPGGTWPSKRWGVESFGKLARLARGRVGMGTVVITGPGEDGIANAVRAASGGAARVLPLQSIRSVASVLASSSAVVANDGGILHMAVALARPTVGVFGPTEPDIWFPYEGKGPFAVVTRHEECAPCHMHQCDHMGCLSRIGPEEVLARLEGVLAWKG